MSVSVVLSSEWPFPAVLLSAQQSHNWVRGFVYSYTLACFQSVIVSAVCHGCSLPSGTVPVSLSALTELVTLRLCNTSLTGTVPAALYSSSMVSLATLQITLGECTLNCTAG